MPGLRFENNVTYGELHYAAYLLILTKIHATKATN